MRRRFIVVAGELVEVTGAPAPTLRVDSGALWSDKGYTGLRATDGADISTRTKHREYMKARGLTTVDDFNGEFQRAAKERADFYQGAPDSSRAQELARAMERSRG